MKKGQRLAARLSDGGVGLVSKAERGRKKDSSRTLITLENLVCSLLVVLLPKLLLHFHDISLLLVSYSSRRLQDMLKENEGVISFLPGREYA